MLKKYFSKENICWIIFAAVIFTLITFLMKVDVIGSYYQITLYNICINIILAVSLNLIIGVCGQFSLGHAGFMCIGAYSAAIVVRSMSNLLGFALGVGIGIVLRVGASTGGMDIPPLILHKKLGVPISVTMNVLDISILLLQMLFSDQEAVLYGILQVLIYTTILNRVLLMGNSRMQVKIISRQYQAINEAIATRLDRGATLLKARTGYLKEDGFVVMTVINSRELAHLNRLIQEIDPKAFIIINQVNEVRGRGFTLQKKDA